jgi:hypothetical protein
MSKAVRIREHLYAEIEALAQKERRSIIGQLEVLLEQALAMESIEEGRLRTAPADPLAVRVPIEVPADGTEVELDSEPRRIKKRLYACPHYVPPSKVCEVCDVEGTEAVT